MNCKSCCQFPLPHHLLSDAVDSAQDWAICNGLMIVPKKFKDSSSQLSSEKHQDAGTSSITSKTAPVLKNLAKIKLSTHVPFTLLPSPFPQLEFKKALSIQKDLNRLQFLVSMDHEYLIKVLTPTAKADPFTKRLLDILLTCHKEGIRQPISFGIFRSDYMLHSSSHESLPRIKQIEMNTIACSLLGLGSRTCHMHRFLCEQYEFTSTRESCLPENDILSNAARAFSEAHRMYGNKNAVVLMVVQPQENNVFDQRLLDFRIFQEFKIRTIRRSLSYIHEHAVLGDDFRLFIDDLEIAIAYFRSGYSPDDYPSEKEWDARLLLERSKAIKCPSVNVHLSGAKKIQQDLAHQGVLEKIFPQEPDLVASIRQVFVGLYSLDHTCDSNSNKMVQEIVEKAKRNPRNYVLKPQREGGGNNLYDEQLVKKLSEAAASELSSYILMERIYAPQISNYFVRGDNGTVTLVDNVVSELGIYGSIIRDGSSITLNEMSGHLLRSKSAADADGGVQAGVAVLDSPFLF